jgi:hypothetical protein
MVGRSQTKGPIGGVVGLVFNKNQCGAIIIIIIFGLKTIKSSFNKGLKNLTSSNFELFEKIFSDQGRVSKFSFFNFSDS